MTLGNKPPATGKAEARHPHGPIRPFGRASVPLIPHWVLPSISARSSSNIARDRSNVESRSSAFSESPPQALISAINL
jgi:hypothetical protein